MRILDNISVDGIIDGNSGTYFEIAVPDSAVNDFCLCLNLLSYELIPSFKIGQQTILEIACDRQLVNTYGNGFYKGNVVSAQLSRDALGYMSAFYLRYVRDGVSAVGHIDLELPAKNSAKTVFLTFTIKSVRLPIANT